MPENRATPEAKVGLRDLVKAGEELSASQGVSQTVAELVRVMERIAGGQYSNDIYPLTRDDKPESVRRIAEAMGMMMVKVEAREHRLRMYAEELQHANELLKRTMVSFVISMANALGARDPYTQGHDQRTAGYAMRLARRIGLDQTQAESIYIGAVLHDIGKIGFPDWVFSAEDCSASPELFETIKKHPGIGAGILDWLDFLGPSRDCVTYHHEKMDGSGYPEGLSGQDIPLGARIVAVADTFDAITTDRPYKKGRDMEQGVAILEEIAGSHLDAELVREFCLEIRENGME
jgi:HD-GYP domain-containing protein (c-di-GMP phosphodiesterase class II)